ncbi:hypothetical protein CC79DRAFT_1049363 [Sarocladium strictum]
MGSQSAQRTFDVSVGSAYVLDDYVPCLGILVVWLCGLRQVYVLYLALIHEFISLLGQGGLCCQCATSAGSRYFRIEVRAPQGEPQDCRR